MKKDEAKTTKPLPQMAPEPDEDMEVITDWDGPENLETSDLSAAPSLMRAAAAQAAQKAPIEPLASVFQQGPPTKDSHSKASTSTPYPTTRILAKQVVMQ